MQRPVTFLCSLLGVGMLLLALPSRANTELPWLSPPLAESGRAAFSAGNPGVTGGEHVDWQRWGSGEMTWFGLALYRATLWVGGRAKPPLLEGSPLALALEYRRDIPAERIVRASVDEMKSLGAPEASLLRWESEMRRVFPDVRKGDVLTGVLTPGEGARFFLQRKSIGEIRDAEFARRFFAIWLDPATSAPEVRSALLRQGAE